MGACLWLAAEVERLHEALERRPGARALRAALPALQPRLHAVRQRQRRREDVRAQRARERRLLSQHGVPGRAGVRLHDAVRPRLRVRGAAPLAEQRLAPLRDVREDVRELLIVATGDHAVSFVEREEGEVAEGRDVLRAGAHQVPEAAGGGHDDRGAVAEQPRLLLDGDAADDGGDADAEGLRDGAEVVGDLQRELSRGAEDEGAEGGAGVGAGRLGCVGIWLGVGRICGLFGSCLSFFYEEVDDG